MGNCPDCPFVGDGAHTSAQVASTIARYKTVTGDRTARIGEISFSQQVEFCNFDFPKFVEVENEEPQL